MQNLLHTGENSTFDISYFSGELPNLCVYYSNLSYQRLVKWSYACARQKQEEN